MKILVISNIYPPFVLGGYELGCRNLVNGLRSHGHQVLVLTSPSHIRDNDPDQVGNADGNNHIIRKLQLKSFQPVTSPIEPSRLASEFEAMVSNYSNTSIVLDTINEFSPDCIYMFNLVGIGGLAIIDAINATGIPWAMHLMDAVPKILQEGFSQEILSIFNADQGNIYKNGQIISMSKLLVKEIETALGISFPNKVTFIPGWARSSDSFLQREYFHSGNVRFVTAGNVQPHKGIDIIINAVAALKRTGVENFTVDIYGDGDIARYIGMTKQLNVADHVIFHGQKSQADLIEIYKLSDVFLFPTWEREPFGFAPVEAASVGCIPVITGTCGVAERLVDQVNCFKIERNPESLCKIMKAFCRMEIDSQKIGHNAQMITKSELSFDACLRDAETILQECTYSSAAFSAPTWRDYNLAYLKNNLAFKLYHTEIQSSYRGGFSQEVIIILKKIARRLNLLRN